MSSFFADGGFVLLSLKRFDCIIIFLRKHSLSEKSNASFPVFVSGFFWICALAKKKFNRFEYTP